MLDAASVSLRPPPRYRPVREFLGVHPALVLLVVGALFVPRLTSTYWTFNVMVGLVLAISCLGLLVVVGWAREISLAQAGLTGSALYLSMWAGTESEATPSWPFPVAASLGIGFAVVVSFLTALASMRLAGSYVIVLTLSVQFWLENSVLLSDRFTHGHFVGVDRPDFFGIAMRRDDHYYYLIFGSLLVVMGFLHRSRHSRFGRSMIMAGADPVAAAVVGVPPWRYRIWAFVVAGGLAGLAGALTAPLYFSPPGTLQWISFNSMFYVAIPVLAGFDSIAGTVLVAVVFTLIPQIVLSWKLNVYLLGGVAMAVGCLLGPRGLGGPLADRFGGRAA